MKSFPDNFTRFSQTKFQSFHAPKSWMSEIIVKNPYNKSGISVHKIESPYPKKHPMNRRKNIVLFNFSEIWIPYFFNEIKSKPMHENRKNPLY